MLDLLFVISDSIGAFFTDIWSFLTDGIYTVLTWAFAKFIELSTMAFLDFVIWALPFAWNVAKQIMTDLNLSALVSAGWSQLDSAVLAYATAFRLPEAVNILLSALITKFVLRFIPFL